MRTTRLNESIGPSWESVAEWLKDLASGNGLSAEIRCMVMQTFWEEPGTFWEVVTWSHVEQGIRRDEMSTGHIWPNRRWVSVPAMLVALIHEHEKVIQQNTYYTKSGKLRRPKGG